MNLLSNKFNYGDYIINRSIPLDVYYSFWYQFVSINIAIDGTNLTVLYES